MSTQIYYCTVYDVAQVMGLNVGRFSDETLPAKETVDMLIRMQMDYVDRYCYTAWRERWNYEISGDTRGSTAAAGYEYHRIPKLVSSPYLWRGIPIKLNLAPIRALDRSKGDSLQVYNGSVWEEWLDYMQYGENQDYWLRLEDGILYLRRLMILARPYFETVRVRYRFGHYRVPEDIRYATALLVAAHLVESGDYNVLLPEGSQNVVIAREKSQLWRERAYDVLERYKRVVVPD